MKTFILVFNAAVALTLTTMTTMTTSTSAAPTDDPRCLRGLVPIRDCLGPIKPDVWSGYFRMPSYQFRPDALLEQCRRRGELDSARACVTAHLARCGPGHPSPGYMGVLLNSIRFHEALCDDPAVDPWCLMTLKVDHIQRCALDKMVAQDESGRMGDTAEEEECARAEAALGCAADALSVCDPHTGQFYRSQRANVLPVHCPR